MEPTSNPRQRAALASFCGPRGPPPSAFKCWELQLSFLNSPQGLLCVCGGGEVLVLLFSPSLPAVQVAPNVPLFVGGEIDYGFLLFFPLHTPSFFGESLKNSTIGI